ncbi:MAG: CHAT domain-containing protein [Bacteroidetes bacterium]|nr:CHAT domain-containing protein [Bacteroidota bacterium]
MPSRVSVWKLVVPGVLALGVVLAGVWIAVTVGQDPADASTELTAGERAYWRWVGHLQEDGAEALGRGLDLVERYPDQSRLYLRLAEHCRAMEDVSACRTVFDQVEPRSARARLYRETGYALLLGPVDTDEALVRWQSIAHDAALDPTLARLVVDHAPVGEAGWLDETERWWRFQLSRDSTDAGITFGLGYAAMRRQAWGQAEELLRRATATAPDDPVPYRQLARIYQVTDRPERFEAVLMAGIEAAEARNDLAQIAALEGTLRWAQAWRAGRLDEAERHLDVTLTKSRTLADERTEGITLFRLAALHHERHRYDAALEVLDAAELHYTRHLRHRAPEVMVLRGQVLSGMLRYRAAERTLEAAVAAAEDVRNRLVTVQATIALAELRHARGRHRAAREAGQRALMLAQQLRAVDQEIAARVVLGEVAQREGDLDEALTHLQAGLTLAETAQHRVRIRELHSKLGLTALRLGDATTAKEHFGTMLDAMQDQVDRFALAEACVGLGRTYAQFQNPEEAIRYFDRALALLRAEDSDGDERLRVEALIGKAWALLDLGALDRAEAHLLTAQELLPDDRAATYRIATARGWVALERAAYWPALDHFQAATATYRPGQRPPMQWQVTFGTALAHWRLGHPRRAERAFEASVAAIEAVRNELQRPSSRSSYVQNKTQVYEHFAAFLEERGRSADAFYYTERARSRSLVDLLYTSQQERRTRGEQAARPVLTVNQRFRSLTPDPEAVDASPDGAAPPEIGAMRDGAPREELGRLAWPGWAFDGAMATAAPLFTFDTLPADSVRFTLANREAMVVYDLRRIGLQGRRQDASVAYVVLPNEIITLSLDVDEDLEEAVIFLREHIGSEEGGPGEGWEPAARRLYDVLIAPLKSALPGWVNHLHIVPEGVLNYLPFAVLQGPEGRFLVEDYALSVVPSAGTLKLCRQQNPRRWRSILLFADPDGGLPGSRSEVLAIQRESPNRRHVFTGAQATQATLEDVAGQYDILHFATHGRFIRRAPWRSHLELHGGERLTVEEIGRLDLDAYLVTLSACETALSGGRVNDVPSGDEWIGLNQAFLTAGTPTVMASLWPIDDRVSGAFMIDFYDQLGPRGKAQALADVQRRFIRDGRWHHPFYWAPFTIIGDPL